MCEESSTPGSQIRIVQCPLYRSARRHKYAGKLEVGSLISVVSNRIDCLDCKRCCRPVKSLILGILNLRRSIRDDGSEEVKWRLSKKEKIVGVL